MRPTGRAPRIGIVGVLGSGNWGNDVALDVVMQMIGRRFPGAELRHMVMDPQVVTARYGGTAIALQWFDWHGARFGWVPGRLLKGIGRFVLDPIRTWRWARGVDVAIVPGMGVFESTAPMPPWAMPLTLVSLAVAGRLTGTPVAFVDVGANVPPSRLARVELRWAARLVDYLSFRDARSRDSVAQLGADVRHAPVHVDLFYAAELPERVEWAPGTAAMGLMNFQGSEADRADAEQLHQRYVASVTRLVAGMVSDGMTVRMVTGDREDRDTVVAVCDGVVAAVPGAARLIKVESVDSMASFLSVLGSCEVAVVTRFHNLLGALRLGVPTYSLSYAAKSEGVLAAMGVESFGARARDFDPDLVLEQVRHLRDRREEISALLRERDRDLSSRAQVQLDELADFISEATGTKAAPDTGPGCAPDVSAPDVAVGVEDHP